MEEPTISDGLLSTAIKRVLAGDDREQIAEDLKKSIQEGRLKGSENSSSFIMTINMNGPAEGKGTAEKRRICFRLYCVVLLRPVQYSAKNYQENLT